MRGQVQGRCPVKGSHLHHDCPLRALPALSTQWPQARVGPCLLPGFGDVHVQDLAASVETDVGLPVPGPSDKMSLGLKEQCPLLPCALAWRLRAARRLLRPQAAACWVQWLPSHTHLSGL